jgi:uncharacterized membrane protein YkoI
MVSIRRKLVTATAIGATALGGATLANAATSSSGSTASTAASSSTPAQPPAHRDPSKGGHQANGKTEALLTGDTAAKVKAAALAKVPGTVERVETDADHGSPYEAHIRKADGTEVEVLVNSGFTVTAVNTMGQR